MEKSSTNLKIELKEVIVSDVNVPRDVSELLASMLLGGIKSCGC